MKDAAFPVRVELSAPVPDDPVALHIERQRLIEELEGRTGGVEADRMVQIQQRLNGINLRLFGWRPTIPKGENE
jgi:hypothetical protein